MSAASENYEPSTMCFKIGKHLTMERYAEMMKSLAWFSSDENTQIKFIIQFTSRMETKERIMTPRQICTEIDRLINACKNMPEDLKETIIDDYLR